MKTTAENKAKLEQYKKEHIKRVPLDMQNELYDRLKAHAVMSGIPVNRYIKESIIERMDKEDKREGIDPEVNIRVNERGQVEFYRRYEK